jgi:hypothetical protein
MNTKADLNSVRRTAGGKQPPDPALSLPAFLRKTHEETYHAH